MLEKTPEDTMIRIDTDTRRRLKLMAVKADVTMRAMLRRLVLEAEEREGR